jgi:hypothetical protein
LAPEIDGAGKENTVMSEGPKSWIMVPRAKRGAKTEDEIHLAVGATLSEWEGVEEGLAEVFALFIGAPEAGPASGHQPAIRAYGSINSFQNRLGMVAAAAQGFFHKAKADDLTSEQFSQLAKEANGFAARRNDIAHGRAQFIPQKGYYLLPGLYSSGKNPVDQPAIYAYNATQIHRYREQFRSLSEKLTDYAIFASAWEPPKPSREKPPRRVRAA